MTISFVVRVLALISNSFISFFNFLWGLPSNHAKSSETIQTSFPFLECRVLQHNCARVLYGAVLEEASWAEPPSSHWFRTICCILSFI